MSIDGFIPLLFAWVSGWQLAFGVVMMTEGRDGLVLIISGFLFLTMAVFRHLKRARERRVRVKNKRGDTKTPNE